VVDDDVDRSVADVLARSTPVAANNVDELFTMICAGYDRLTSLDVPSLGAEAVVDVLHRQEALRRRMIGFDHRLTAELSELMLTERVPARSAREFLVDSLRLSPREAGARVQAAVDLGPRRNLIGEALAPLFPLTVAAQGAGLISEQHAAVIRRTVTGLSPAIEAEHGARCRRNARRAGRPVSSRSARSARGPNSRPTVPRRS
jgi:hypothetical protein